MPDLLDKAKNAFFGSSQQYLPQNIFGRSKSADGSTPRGGAPAIQAGDLSQDTVQEPTLRELVGGGASDMGAGLGQSPYAASPLYRFGFGPENRPAFGGGMQMGGNQMAGLMGGGDLVWGGGVMDGGGEGGNNSVNTTGQGGPPTAAAGGMAPTHGGMEMMGGGVGNLMHGGSTPTQHGLFATPGQPQQQQQYGGMGMSGALFPQTPVAAQAGGIGGALAAPTNTGGTAQGIAQSPSGEPGEFLVLQALGDKVGNHESTLVEKERGLQTDDEKEEKDEVLAYAEALLFLHIQKNSHIPRLFHSPTICPEDQVTASSNMGGKTVAFTARTNVAMLCPNRAMWESKNVTIPAGTDAITQRSESGRHVWSETGEGTSKSLRRAFLFPSSLAEIGVEWIKKGFDVLDCYEDLCAKFPGEDQYADLKEWLLGASQGTASGGSFLSLDLQTADQDDPAFGKWCKEVLQLKKVLPAATSPAVPPQPTAPQQAAAPTTPATTGGTASVADPNLALLVQAQVQAQQNFMTMLQQQQQMQLSQNTVFFNQMQHAAMGGGVGNPSSSSTSGTSANRSEDTVAALISLSHKRTMGELSWWWTHVWQAKKGETAQKWKEAKEWILKWAQRNGLPIHKAFEPDEEVLWAWMNGDFQSSKDFSKGATKKLSPYSAMPMFTEEIERRRKKTEGRGGFGKHPYVG